MTRNESALEKSLGKILIIDDDEDVLLAAKLLLKKHAHQVIIEKNPKKIPFLLNNDTYDVILLDMNYSKDITSGKEGFFWLSQILEQDPSAVVIMITAYGDIEMAVRALKEGATDFVLKPWQNEKLLATISTAIKLNKSYKEVDKLKKAKKQLEKDINQPFREIIGSSASIKQVFDQIERVAGTDDSILIYGENGTGKELIARAIHQRSARKENSFITADLSISPDTSESELFGYREGAFTDAHEDKIGRFELANEGTLFLDEVGSLNMPVQEKLLTALQKGEIPVPGVNEPLAVDVRLISATNMPLKLMANEGKLHQELLTHISAVEIKVPALRERKEDIDILSKHFVDKYAKKYRKNVTGITSEGISKLEEYPWPGNIRELEHAVERAIIMSENELLTANDFFFLSTQKSDGGDISTNTFNLDEVEKTLIQKAIEMHEGNISRAAQDLGLTRAALYRRLEKHGL
jgi:two-component system response regulator HydG